MKLHVKLCFACVCWAVTMALATGCGSKGIPGEKIELRQQLFDEGSRKFKSGDFSGARTELDAALSTAGLSTDQFEDATLMRAESLIRLGELDQAQKDIDLASQGVGDTARLNIIKGIMARKKGDEAAAQAFFQKAQQENPDIEIPKS